MNQIATQSKNVTVSLVPRFDAIGVPTTESFAFIWQRQEWGVPIFYLFGRSGVFFGLGRPKATPRPARASLIYRLTGLHLIKV